MLPAAPYIIDVEDMEKMAGQLHVFTDKAITLASRQLNKMVHSFIQAFMLCMLMFPRHVSKPKPQKTTSKCKQHTNQQ